MRLSERTALREYYGFRCGYCGVSETAVGAELTVDHFQPRSQGGLDEPENWVYCCHACNEFKGDYWQPDSVQRILHPLRDRITEHLVLQDDGNLRPITLTGTFHIERLHLNRAGLVAHRREQQLVELAHQVQAELLQRLAQLEIQVQSITAQLEQLERNELPPSET
ncbi:MAG: HNH endonuclease [Abitibacteriaceae bacterium]|nr:HNH endonuclease [Abditibacteriaceae bacterium]